MDSRTNEDVTFPEAAGVRIEWDEVPAAVRAAVEDELGSAVVAHATQRGGFSPGVASRLRLADGRRLFVKAVSAERNPDTPGIHRREARVMRALPERVPAPRLLFELDLEGWIVLGLEDVDGRHPTLPWDVRELRLVVDAIVDLTETLTPSPMDAPTFAEHLSSSFRGFRNLEAALAGDDESVDLASFDPWVVREVAMLAELESRWEIAARGDTLLHCDLRADNILLTGDQVRFVDWPHVSRGAPWIELMCVLPSVSMQGGPEPWEVFDASPLTVGVDARDVDTVLCAFAGYFAWNGSRPDPPGIPTVRAFQRAQGRHALRWLRHRLGC